MRKKQFCVVTGLFSLFLSLFVFCGCERVQNMGTLPEFSKPYAGEYVCESLLLGGEEQVQKFDYIKLTLRADGKFELCYSLKQGGEGEFSGAYTVNADGNVITLSGKAGQRTVEHTFPMEQGAIFMDLNVHGKLLHAKFVFP